MRLSLQQNNLILETQQCSFSNYFKSLLPNQSKLFFSLREQFIYQITVISCTVSLLLPHTHPNKPPTSAFPNETTTSITSGLILLWFIACTSHTHTHTLPYFAELVFLTDSRFHRRAVCFPSIHRVISPPNPTAEAVRGSRSCGSMFSQALSSACFTHKIKGDFAWYFFYSNGMWHQTTPHKYPTAKANSPLV